MIADANAKVALWEKVVHNQSTPVLSPPSTTIPPVTLEVGSEQFTICSKLFKNLMQCISRKQAMEYWKTKNVPIDDENSDIEAFKHAARNTPNWQQRWLAKWFSGICGVGRMLKRWKDQPHSKCPICLTDDETVSHVIHCKHADASSCWHTNLEGVRSWMLSNDFLPGLAEAVYFRLSAWRNEQPFLSITHFSDEVQELILAQDNLGWDAFCFPS